MIGQTVSHYRIEEKLGEGGMGVVYRARDLSLNRSVAIKFISSEVADAERRERFQREAQTASSLNHPHILTVFEAGAIDGRQYLVTEYIEGSTLSKWSRKEKPPLHKVVELAVGIADALACAHGAGIVHRDVKPENILVSRQGFAKLVDFGLAKLLEGERGSEETTITQGKTRPGAILGTVAYMSPEQATGKVADERSDIFSFGVVLYELLAGERPFDGSSSIDLLHAIVHDVPQPLAEVRPDVPTELRIVVDKALEKDPEDRYQSMREMVVDLKRVQRHRAAPAVELPKRGGKAWIAWTAVAVFLLVSALAGAWMLRRSDFFWKNPLAGATFYRFTDFEGTELDPAISSDGKFVTFFSDRDGPFDAWVSQVGGGELINLTKGKFANLPSDTHHRIGFSGDGVHVSLWSAGGLWLVPILGGMPRKTLGDHHVTWSPDGSKMVYYTGYNATEGEKLFVADRNGNDPAQIFVDGRGGHGHYLVWSPDGRYIYFVRGEPRDHADVWRVRSDGRGEAEQITHHNSRVSYPALIDNQTLLYIAPAEDGTGFWLYATDVERRIPHRVSLGVEQYTSIAASTQGRRLVATVSNPSGNLWTVPITEGVVEEISARRFSLPTVRGVAPRFGPNYILYLSSKGGEDGLWKFKDGSATEIWRPSDGPVGYTPAISPDGRQICFSIRKRGRMALRVMTVDGINVRPLAESLDIRGTASWFPDGKSLLVGATEGNGSGLFRVPVDGGPPERWMPGDVYNPVFSTDSRRIVYLESPQLTNHLLRAITSEKKPIPLPDIRVGSHRDGCRFLPDGKVVVLLGTPRRENFWLLDLDTGRLRQLTNLQPGYSVSGFDISPDGKEILFDRVRDNSDIVLIDLPSR